nr:T9SS type A sorting domain-containing protein [Bacteroidota bacterium]
MTLNPNGYLAEFNFDRCSGSITLFNSIYSEQSNNWNRLFWEGAYSPNDSLFYIATSGVYKVDTLYLLQFNLFATYIPASCDTLDTILYPIGTGAVRLAPDGKIYCTRAYDNPFVFSYPYPDSMRNYINENLSVINNPNALGAACNYTPFSFYLGGKRTYYGLPNNPNYSLGRLLGSACDTLQWVSTPETPNPLQGGLNAGFIVSPNPVSKNLFFNAKNAKGKNALIQIRNALGEIIFYKNVEVINGGYITQTIDVSLFCNGIYFISLLMENETTSMRFIKE